MGPSGSGKTTLMNAIAGRVKKSKNIQLSGSRYINGEQIAGDVQVPAAFIEQESIFFPQMTVKETLDFRVELKIGSKLGKSAKDDIVANLMETLGLEKVANTKVGSARVRGISGGERKRLSIACEMISSPSVIFLDEPTSGLDSFQAEQVVATMRKVADSGKTVIAVIHQPSQRVFSMFDDLLLLSEGKQMYFGNLKKVRSYFQSIGYGAPLEVGTAEHVLDKISRVTGNDTVETESTKRLDTIATYARNEAKMLVCDHQGKSSQKKRDLGGASKIWPAAGIFRQFILLLTRSLREVFRGEFLC